MNAPKQAHCQHNAKEVTALTALRKGLCPRCRRGRIFYGRFKMHPRCQQCDLVFEREHGYFVGAMYMHYVMGSLYLALVITLLINTVLPDWYAYQIIPFAVLTYLPLLPAAWRYSRIIWIHLDRLVDP